MHQIHAKGISLFLSSSGITIRVMQMTAPSPISSGRALRMLKFFNAFS